MIEVIELAMTCPMCPSQWEGKTSDGRFIYARYRWGHLQVGVGDSLDAAVGNAIDDGFISKELGDEMHGELTFAELIEHTRNEVSWPAQFSSSEMSGAQG